MKNNFFNKNKTIFPILFIVFTAFSGLLFFISQKKSDENKIKFILNYKKVNSAFEYMKFCKKGNGEACLHSAFYYLNGKNVLPNLKKASKFLLKACNFNNAKGCFLLGKLWLKTKNHHFNKIKAKKYLKKACKLQFQEACEAILKLK
jgi:TPR repeat protein